MTIADSEVQDKGIRAAKVPTAVLAGVCLLLAIAAGIGIGLIMAREGRGPSDQLWIEQLPADEHPSGKTSARSNTLQAAAAAAQPPLTDPDMPADAPKSLPAGGMVVASKTGAVYYFPWCGGALNLSDDSKITFASAADAENAGYRPAKNCKGM